jgi:hypothetical protein
MSSFLEGQISLLCRWLCMRFCRGTRHKLQGSEVSSTAVSCSDQDGQWWGRSTTSTGWVWGRHLCPCRLRVQEHVTDPTTTHGAIILIFSSRSSSVSPLPRQQAPSHHITSALHAIACTQNASWHPRDPRSTPPHRCVGNRPARSPAEEAAGDLTGHNGRDQDLLRLEK